MLRILQNRLSPDRQGAALVFALDDSPIKRYGPHVEGAGKHHNPTPGPAGAKFLYGHVWVCLAWLVRHPRWGTIALPILSLLYIRAKAATVATLMGHRDTTMISRHYAHLMQRRDHLRESVRRAAGA